MLNMLIYTVSKQRLRKITAMENIFYLLKSSHLEFDEVSLQIKALHKKQNTGNVKKLTLLAWLRISLVVYD